MRTLSLRTTIAADGTISLKVPSDLPLGDAEVVIVVQPAISPPPAHDAPPYRSDHGVWRDKLPDVDIDAELREMNDLWKSGMELPE